MIAALEQQRDEIDASLATVARAVDLAKDRYVASALDQVPALPLPKQRQLWLQAQGQDAQNPDQHRVLVAIPKNDQGVYLICMTPAVQKQTNLVIPTVGNAARQVLAPTCRGCVRRMVPAHLKREKMLTAYTWYCLRCRHLRSPMFLSNGEALFPEGTAAVQPIVSFCDLRPVVSAPGTYQIIINASAAGASTADHSQLPAPTSLTMPVTQGPARALRPGGAADVIEGPGDWWNGARRCGQTGTAGPCEPPAPPPPADTTDQIEEL